jgi:hypothetical protein
VSYHLSQDDADNNLAAILGTYQNTTNAEEILLELKKRLMFFVTKPYHFLLM